MMASATFEKAMKLAVVTGMRAALGPALLARANHRPEEQTLAMAAVGEMVVDKLPLVPSRDTLASLVVRGVAGYWVAKTCMEDENEVDPWVGPLGAAVAMGVAVAAPKIRRTLGWTTGMPQPILGLLEDYLALRLGTEAVGLSMDEITHVAQDVVGDMKERVMPTLQSLGAGSM
jgi:hypothetical protein